MSGAVLPGCAASAPAQVRFEHHEIATGSAPWQTVLTGYLLGGPVADLAVVSGGASDVARLRIFAFGDSTWTPAFDAPLGPDVSFVDVGRIGGHDRLIVGEPGGLGWFAPESADMRPLVPVDTRHPPRGGYVHHVDVTRDVNGDGRDDLVVPGPEGFHVFVQMEDGAFAAPVTVGPAIGPGTLYAGDGYRHAPWGEGGRVHQVDFDLDGRGDLVYWNDDHFAAYMQDGRGRFAPVAAAFTTDIAFDTDDLSTLAAPRETRNRLRDHELEGDLTGRALHSLADHDDDGIADLVVFSLKGGSLCGMRSSYEVHMGARAPDGGITFAPEAGAAIEADGIPFGVLPRDIDGDGQVDVMYTTTSPSVFNVVGMLIRAVLTRSLPLDLDIYRMDDGAYAEKPDVARKFKVHIPGDSGEKSALYPPVLIGDVTGDGRADLIVGRGTRELRVYPGVQGPDLFARRPASLAVATPREEEYAWLADLDGDGTQEVIMHLRPEVGGDRVMVLRGRQGTGE